MSTDFSSTELHHFKTGMLAAMMKSKMPADDLGMMGTGELTSHLPEFSRSDGAKQNDDKYSSTFKANYIRHLNSFFTHVKIDDRLKAAHVSLYLALFHVWNCNHFPDQFQVNRWYVMQLCKIGSRSTYLNALKFLHACGYITYYPGRRAFQRARASITTLTEESYCALVKAKQKGSTSGPEKDLTGNGETGPQDRSQNGAYAGSYNASYKGPNPGTINKQINNETGSKQIHAQKPSFFNEEKIPTIEKATLWFSQRGQTPQEARRFFYHYEAINWRLGGNPITNWEAAAIKWCENAKKFNHDKPGKLHTDNNKDYSKPF